MIIPKPSLNIKEYLKAIKTTHGAKNEPLNVHKDGRIAYWNPQEDDGWIAYSKARFEIARYKRIDKFLQLINYI